MMPRTNASLNRLFPHAFSFLLIAFLLSFPIPPTYLHPSFVISPTSSSGATSETSQSSSSSLQKIDGDHGQPSGPQKILILTAHPDDESMFFGPVILGLIEEGHEVSGLCLSTGNASSLGPIRSSEFISAYSILGIPSERVTVLDHPDLQDGMTTEWDPRTIAIVLEERFRMDAVDVVITFDQQGVSRHPNHVSLPFAFTTTNLHAQLLHPPTIQSSSTSTSASTSKPSPVPPPNLYTLKTVPLYKKYTAFNQVLARKSRYLLGAYYDWLFWLLGAEGLKDRLITTVHFATSTSTTSTSTQTSSESRNFLQPESQIFLSTPSQYLKTLRAMREHRSQMVWFRWLYVGTSGYMWGGEIERVDWGGRGVEKGMKEGVDKVGVRDVRA